MHAFEKSSHCFALHVSSLNDLEQPQGLVITDSAVIHRMSHVLRLSPEATCILFDDTHHMTVKITQISRKYVLAEALSKEPHVSLSPSIDWLLPVLKRDAFEAVLYSLTEMGATSIYPVYTAKTARSWGSSKDYERARAIMVAAAEQSKQFSVPPIHPIQELTSWKPTGSSVRIFFDGEGMPIKELCKNVVNPLSMVGCVGPEADLTPQEKAYLRQEGFLFCSLTPTVLRAQQAIALGLGLLRSYYR